VAWTDLAEAAFALRKPADSEGIPWVATNTDWTIPQARGTAPGNGTLVSAVHTAVGRLPVVAGKPERAIFNAAVLRFGAEKPLFLGDRLDTDIVGANRAGMASALVLTGIDGPKQVLAADKDSRPTFLLGDLRELFEPYPTPVESSDKKTGDRVFRSGDAIVRLAGNAVRVDAAGARSIDLLRAGCAAVWGAGVPIYALDVAPELYS
jgi:glycerol 3-phosphatase-2